MPKGAEVTQCLVECNMHVKLMMMLLEPHTSDSRISMGTTMHNTGGTGTTLVDHHGMMGISSPMQKRLSYFRTSASVTSRPPSTVSKEDGRDLHSQMACGKVSCLTVIWVCSLHGLVFLRRHSKLCKAIYAMRVED